MSHLGRAMPLPLPDPTPTSKRILVAGGGGFNGSRRVRRWVSEGQEVHVLLGPTGDATRLCDIRPVLRMHRLAIDDHVALRACLNGPRPAHIYHFAHGTGRRHDGRLAGTEASVSDRGDLLVLLEEAAATRDPPRSFVLAEVA